MRLRTRARARAHAHEHVFTLCDAFVLSLDAAIITVAVVIHRRVRPKQNGREKSGRTDGRTDDRQNWSEDDRRRRRRFFFGLRRGGGVRVYRTRDQIGVFLSLCRYFCFLVFVLLSASTRLRVRRAIYARTVLSNSHRGGGGGEMTRAYVWSCAKRADGGKRTGPPSISKNKNNNNSRRRRRLDTNAVYRSSRNDPKNRDVRFTSRVQKTRRLDSDHGRMK